MQPTGHVPNEGLAIGPALLAADAHPSWHSPRLTGQGPAFFWKNFGGLIRATSPPAARRRLECTPCACGISRPLQSTATIATCSLVAHQCTSAEYEAHTAAAAASLGARTVDCTRQLPRYFRTGKDRWICLKFFRKRSFMLGWHQRAQAILAAARAAEVQGAATITAHAPSLILLGYLFRI